MRKTQSEEQARRIEQATGVSYEQARAALAHYGNDFNGAITAINSGIMERGGREVGLSGEGTGADATPPGKQAIFSLLSFHSFN